MPGPEKPEIPLAQADAIEDEGRRYPPKRDRGMFDKML